MSAREITETMLVGYGVSPELRTAFRALIDAERAEEREDCAKQLEKLSIAVHSSDEAMAHAQGREPRGVDVRIGIGAWAAAQLREQPAAGKARDMPVYAKMVPTRRERLVEFHRAVGQAINDSPVALDDKTARLRGKLVVEEAFEFAEALVDTTGQAHLRELKTAALNALDCYDVRVDLPAAADALEDTDYVVEGSRLALGINERCADEIAAAVHAANMTKASGPVGSDGKRGKPPGFVAPDIASILQKHGWRG